MIRRLGFYLLVIAPLALAACSDASDDQSGQSKGANGVDPALASALQDQIMVDPGLGQQANGDAVRPPGQPYSGGVPADGVAANTDAVDAGKLERAPAPATTGKDCPECKASSEAVTLGGLAARQKDSSTAACAASLQYGAAWAQRLPTGLPLYPQARLKEAAGTENPNCKLRVVTFSAAQPLQTMVDWYYTKAKQGGYSAEHQLDGKQHILGGTRDSDGGAYIIYLNARSDGGTDIELIATKGR